MKYIFFDIECANCYQGKGKICSFGYVITDENFEITEQHDMVMNPASKFNLGPDIKLAYSKSEFKSAPLFPMFYDEIDALLTDPDCLVFGFSVNNDARYVRDECKRYNLPYINYRFYDVQQMFMGFEGIKNQPSLAGICAQYGIDESQEIHKSDDDSRMTMEVLQALCNVTGKSVSELIEEYPRSAGESADGEIKWLYVPPKEVKPQSVRSMKHRPKTNNMSFRTKNYTRFLKYIKGLKIAASPDLPLAGRTVCISAGYEGEHYLQMRLIARKIAKYGGRYRVYPNQCDLFVTYDAQASDGTAKRCSRLSRVNEMIEKKGKQIEILSFDDFLKLIRTTEDELDAQLVLLAADSEDTDDAEAVCEAESADESTEETEETEEVESEKIPAVNV